MPNFVPISGMKWIDSKEYDLNKYTRNSLKECILEFDLEYLKELQELHYDYPLVSVKIK